MTRIVGERAHFVAAVREVMVAAIWLGDGVDVVANAAAVAVGICKDPVITIPVHDAREETAGIEVLHDAVLGREDVITAARRESAELGVSSRLVVAAPVVLEPERVAISSD